MLLAAMRVKHFSRDRMKGNPFGGEKSPGDAPSRLFRGSPACPAAARLGHRPWFAHVAYVGVPKQSRLPR
jgi:hypothetical protein